ncbi:MAG: class I SAM-dependent rRNA methyltransferase [Planctomycetota bacterium]|nr:MAG: class I SAM-dependent rRNA methyltransferase [Planctomycetota bacterium]
MSALPTVRLKGRLNSPHPWVWRTRLEASSLPRRAEPGALVRVVDGAGEPVGLGLLHPHVSIGLRLLTRDPAEAIDAAFFRRRFEAARRLREDVLRLGEVGDAYRLMHGEADGISGLVVDVLGEVVRVDLFARGLARFQDELRAALEALYPGKSVVVRADAHSADVEGFRVRPRPDDPTRTEVTEHGVRFEVDLREGHKTGFFLDQRENRDFLARLVRGRSLLDVHCYTGGFSLHAAVRGEARQVVGVDIDEKAIAVAKRNAKRNQARVRFVRADAFPYLRDCLRRGERPEVLVLDPPKLARGRKERAEGLRVYGDLNRLGLEVVAEGGLLLTCSCSGAVSEEDFLDVLRRSAARTRKELTVLRVAGAAADHPVGLHVPETRYLKAVFARVRSL